LFGPDFIGIGMPKSGTGWLFDQLKYHPDFWMPPAKELAYLSRSKTRSKSAEKWLERIDRPGNEGRFRDWANRTENDPRDLEFLRLVTGNIGQDMDLDFYASLFRFKNDALSGDMTAAYGALTPKLLSELQQRLPQVKIILLVREPVGRAWSHLCMWHRKGEFDVKLLEDVNAFRDYLDNTRKLQRVSFPSQVMMAWEQHAPKLSFRYFLFDDIVEHPEIVRREILAYLGADPDKTSGSLDAGYNKKSKKKKLPLEDSIKHVLVEYFADELRACGQVFGGTARSWASNYGL
jgi:hypothetical protein